MCLQDFQGQKEDMVTHGVALKGTEDTHHFYSYFAGQNKLHGHVQLQAEGGGSIILLCV